MNEADAISEWDARFGWWSKWNSGSPEKVGQYEDLASGPFLNVDGLISDGCRTLDLTATESDNVTDKVNAYYYGPGLSATFDYDSFIHQLDHDPINNMASVSSLPNPALPGATNPFIVKQDLNAGDDYAMRVEEFKGSFKGAVCDDNIRIRLDVWGMEKDGTRQVNAVGMCFSQTSTQPLPPGHPSITQTPFNDKCHLLSQAQQIDWKTAEVKPVIEMHLGDNLSLEYSRPMRTFAADDALTSRYYVSTGVLSPTSNPPNPNNPFDYAVVPDNNTQMDQLKVSGLVSDNNRLYAFLMIGSNTNELIEQTRTFNDMDLRWTNTSVKNLSLTAYGKVYNEDEQIANVAELQQPVLNPGVTTTVLNEVVRQPIDYHNTTGGLRGTWRPFGCGYDQGGLAVAAGYEYCDMDRLNALYPLGQAQTSITSPLLPAGSVLDEEHTITNCFQIGPEYRWSAGLDTYLHYKFQAADQPLTGVNASNSTGAFEGHTVYLNSPIFDTLLPQYDNIVEVGFNWFPCDWFMLNASLGCEKGTNNSTPDVSSPTPIANGTITPVNFDEENWPVTINAWYRASNCWSLSAGYSIFSNFVGQNITEADQTLFNNNPASANPPLTQKWNYSGQSHVVTLGTRYALTERITLTGQFEWVRGNDLIYQSLQPTTTAGAPVGSQLGSYCRVTNETTRLTLAPTGKSGRGWSSSRGTNCTTSTTFTMSSRAATRPVWPRALWAGSRQCSRRT